MSSGSDAVAAVNASAPASSGWYTGYDGVNTFSLLFPSYMPVAVQDTRFAKVQSQSMTLDQPTVASLLPLFEQRCPTMSSSAIGLIQQHLAAPRTIFVVSALGAGTTALVALQDGQSGGMGVHAFTGAFGASGTWTSWKAGLSTPLVISNYAPADIAAGKTRDHASIADQAACSSCHETGQTAVPYHQLGDVASLSDTEVATWITSGALGARVASPSHQWTYSDPADPAKVTAYLRTLQGSDWETLTELEVAQEVAVTGGCPAGFVPSGTAGQ